VCSLERNREIRGRSYAIDTISRAFLGRSRISSGSALGAASARLAGGGPKIYKPQVSTTRGANQPGAQSRDGPASKSNHAIRPLPLKGRVAPEETSRFLRI